MFTFQQYLQNSCRSWNTVCPKYWYVLRLRSSFYRLKPFQLPFHLYSASLHLLMNLFLNHLWAALADSRVLFLPVLQLKPLMTFKGPHSQQNLFTFVLSAADQQNLWTVLSSVFTVITRCSCYCVQVLYIRDIFEIHRCTPKWFHTMNMLWMMWVMTLTDVV